MNSSVDKKVTCPVCNNTASFFVSKKDRFGQEYHYVKCNKCRFLFDQDLVLDKNALVVKTGKEYDREYFLSVDSGWKLRGDKIVKVINAFLMILKVFSFGKKMSVLDYGGGNGYVASLVRPDVGVFYYDKYEQPSYKGNYTVIEKPQPANMVFAVELVEHLADMNEWQQITGLSKNIFIFTTEVSNGIMESGLPNWAYVNPDAGHTAIYSFEALVILAKKHGFCYFFFPYKLSHIFIKNTFLSRFNIVGVEYALYVFLKRVKDGLKIW